MMTSLANKPDRCGPRIPAKLFHPKWVGVYFQGLSKQRLILLQRESSLKSWRFFPNPSFPLLFEVLLAFAEKEENPQLHPACCIGPNHFSPFFLLFTYMHVIYLWNLLLCTSKLFLEEKVLSQCSQGRDIPSKWWASMWFLIWFTRPSLPHILQMDEVF